MLNFARFNDRNQAGLMLSEQLKPFGSGRSVVIAPVSNGGVVVGRSIARKLCAKLVPALCRSITHPGDRTKTIGSVSKDETILRDIATDIPQDYLANQVRLLKNYIATVNPKSGPASESNSFENKIVVVTDDWVESSDEVLAAIKSIRKHKPSSIILAFPVIAVQAVIDLVGQADEFKYLHMKYDDEKPQIFFEQFPSVNDTDVRDILISEMSINRAATNFQSAGS